MWQAVGEDGLVDWRAHITASVISVARQRVLSAVGRIRGATCAWTCWLIVWDLHGSDCA